MTGLNRKTTERDIPVPRRMMPPAFRRAVAIAIELEQAHDRMCELIGHSLPLPDQIVPPNARRGQSRVRLPKDLTAEVLTQMQDVRMAAIEEAQEHLEGTLGFGEANVLTDIVERARNTVAARTFERVPRRTTQRRPWDPDLGTPEDMLARDIGRAADATTTIPRIPERTVQVGLPPRARATRESIAIDNVLDGMLEHYGVDRDALHRHLIELHESTKVPGTARDMASPAARSNRHPSLAILGASFPSAILRLRGLSLDVVSMDIPAAANDPGPYWHYRNGHTDKPMLVRNDPTLGAQIHTWPGRDLGAVLDDARFDSVMISRAYRQDPPGSEMPSTLLRIQPGRTHIDPPGTPRPSRNRAPRQDGRDAMYRPLDHVPVIEESMRRHGINRSHRFEVAEGKGLVLLLAGSNGSRMIHRFPILNDTLADGREGIEARTAVIAKYLASFARRKERDGPLFAVNDTGPVPLSGAIPMSGSARPGRRTPTEILATIDQDAETAYMRSSRTCMLLADLLATDARELDADVEFHVQEGVMSVKAMRLNAESFYRLEKFDRLLGKPSHAVATIEIARVLPSGLVEELRDGTIRQYIAQWPEFARSQVRKVSRTQDETLVTIRVPLVDIAHAPSSQTLP